MRGRVRGAGFSDNAGAALALFGGVSVSVATMVLIVALDELFRGAAVSGMLAALAL